MSSFTLRSPAPPDTPAVARLIFDAFASIHDRHNFPRDFPAVDGAMQLAGWFIAAPQRFLGVLAVRDDGKIVGCNFLDVRNPAVPAVGPVCVHPAEQGNGIGKAVMRAVLDRARERDARSVRLVQDAFNTCSMSLYTACGFDVKEPLAVVQGRPAGRMSESGSAVRPMREDDLTGCAELCRRVHGFDRDAELRDALSMFRPMVLERTGRVRAYMSAPSFWILNHGVAETEQDLHDLLAGATATEETGGGNDPIALLVPTRNAALLRWCLNQRMRIAKPMTLMVRGDYREPAGAWFPSVEY